MIGPLGRQGPAATLGQHCPQMTQRPGIICNTMSMGLSTRNDIKIAGRHLGHLLSNLRPAGGTFILKLFMGS